MAQGVDILLPELGGTIGTTVSESLRRHGLDVLVFDDSPFGRDEPGYIRELGKYVARMHPKAIMPIFRAETLARHRDDIARIAGYEVALLCETADKIGLLDDKVRCSALAAGLGIPQPHLYDDDMIDRIGKWPVVFKRAHGLSGSSVYFPKDMRALENLIRSCRVSGKSGLGYVRPHLIMDYVDGYDVSVDAFRGEDGFFAASAYRILWPRGKGISKIRVGTDRPDMVEYARKILDAVGYEGVCGMDFRIERSTGKACFLECNPRFSGGIRSSLEAGLDMPWLLWESANGHALQQPQLRSHRISLSLF